MGELELFTIALGLRKPWQVTRTYFDDERGQLDVYIDFLRGARFPCPIEGCDQPECAVHDTENKTWRHMDFSAASLRGEPFGGVVT